MHPSVHKALREQTEARQAYQSLADDAAETDIASAETRITEADKAVLEALDKAEEAEATAPVELRDRISLGRYMNGIVEETLLDGAERELRQELKLKDNAVPLEALLPTPEERADAVSPQNAAGNAALGFGTINHTVGPMLNRIFTATDTAFLGVNMPTVPAGERVYPIMTDGTSASMVARGDAAPDAGSAKFDVVNATPKRLSGRYVFDLEGVATLGGLLESTLRSDLRMVLGFQMDSQVLLGNGTAPNVSGLLKQIPLELSPGETFQSNDPKGVAGWQDFRAVGYLGLDGKYARTESDMRLLLGQATYELARSSFRNNNAGDAADAVENMRQLGIRVRNSFLIPAPAVATIPPKSANSSKKVQSGLRNAEPGAAVAPVWQGITMIRDPYTNASKAQIVITAHMLFDFVMRRTAGWKQYAFRTEA